MYNYNYGDDDRFSGVRGYTVVPYSDERLNARIEPRDSSSLRKARLMAIRLLALGPSVVRKVIIFKTFTDGFGIEVEEIRGSRKPVAIPYTYNPRGRSYIKAGTPKKAINVSTGAIVKSAR